MQDKSGYKENNFKKVIRMDKFNNFATHPMMNSDFWERSRRDFLFSSIRTPKGFLINVFLSNEYSQIKTDDKDYNRGK